MDHDKYKYILAVAEYQSFSKAADALFISQPYLSKVVSTIERDLGVRLFDRNHMPLSVTAAGKCYIDYIKTVLHAEQQMYAGLTDISEHSSGTISLGIGSTHCSYLMPDVFRRFQDLYPHIRINFTECSNKTMVEYVENGLFDFALYTSPDIPRNLDHTSIKKERLLLVFPPSYPIREIFGKNPSQAVQTLGRDDMHKLSNEKFIILTEHQGLGQFMRTIFEIYELSPKVIYEVKNVETAFRLAAAGFGLTIVPEICLKFLSFQAAPHYYQIGNPPLERHVVMLYQRGRKLSAPEQTLCEIIQGFA